MNNEVRNVAPFINDRFQVTSPWWSYRINPITGVRQLHKGLDIATSSARPVYSIVTGTVVINEYNSVRGNYIVIRQDITNYGVLFQHLASLPKFNIGDKINVGEYVGLEGTTGSSSGIHLHIEIEDMTNHLNTWVVSDEKSDYIDPTEFMGIDNIKDSWWIYTGTPIEQKFKRKKFKWVLYANKIRRYLQ